MKKFTSGGKKDIAGKAPVDMVTLKMLEGITEGMVCGMKKGYEKHNWKKGLPICEAHLGAAIRHIYKYIGGEDSNIEKAKDGTEFSTHHLDNALTHLAMAVHQIKSGRTDLDDREINSKEDWLKDNEQLNADILEAIEQVKQGQIKPLSFELEEDSEWLEESSNDSNKGHAVGFKSKHDWGWDVVRRE
ncbi:hypothetical protein UFOVP1437_24 [uncultured Caudovirales phage]|uniref:dATP/dGTP diphosphohydrolase N-terminal domain-containing protein n=1 Tax=uncultured Caudovirales phage TaxID=2100421 RepID=A0A6J7XG67_9CAUD|nr:hypothetical protein UFOVP1437_24 [uncultured Caudovirales phage]CAB5228146.1 hypothetical protein UFOVP1531_40 [uncultured Caudovirales phage]